MQDISEFESIKVLIVFKSPVRSGYLVSRGSD